MELSLILLKQVIVMLVYLGLGAIGYKCGLISVEGNKSISNWVLYIANPLLIFISFQQDFSVKLLKGLGMTIIFTIVGYLIFIPLAMLFIGKKENRETEIERFSTIYSNCGFMGIPLAKVLLGNEGVFYITAFNMVFNILVWSHGVYMISKDKKQMNIKKVATNPTILATVIGLIFFVLKIRIPEVAYSAFNNVGGTVGPLAMVVAGVTIARTNLLKAVAKPRIYLVTLLKLIVLPVLCAFVFKLIPFDVNETALLATVLAFSCPTATVCTMFSIRYDKNATYSAEIFAVTTLLSVVTMPLVILIM